MPGILLHAYFADEVIKAAPKSHLVANDDSYQQRFMMGNLIPDLGSDKNRTHCRYRLPYPVGILLPDLYEATHRWPLITSPQDAIRAGVLAHLYLDYWFLKDFVIPRFSWEWNTISLNSEPHYHNWTRKEFFGKTGLYRCYGELNCIIIQKQLVDILALNRIPAELPLTGISDFDERKERSWREELNSYLINPYFVEKPIFDIDDICTFFQEKARDFAKIFEAPSTLSL